MRPKDFSAKERQVINKLIDMQRFVVSANKL
jgi:hypothetical protein